MQKPLTFLLACVVVSMVFFGVSTRSAAALDLDPGFDPNFILTDGDILDAEAMPYDRLVNFLRSKGTLADLRTVDIDGVPKTAAEIIWRVSRSYRVNPKYLIALIQKEQSLVEDPAPSQGRLDWAAGYGVCDSCSKDDPSIQDFKGFANQIEWAAKQHREKYLMQLLTNGLTIGGQGAGKTVIIDGLAVTPVNNATAMLYSYTPHLHGNLTLWRIWKRWFTVAYPDGTVARGEPSGTYYLIRYGEKRPFASATVAASRTDVTKAVVVTDSELTSYPEGPTIKFAPYALLRDPSGRIYLLTTANRRHIANMEAFRKFGFNAEEVEEVEAADLIAYPDGPKITVDTTFPQGVLMKTADAAGVWYVEDGIRSPLVDAIYLKLYFVGRRIRIVTNPELATYATTSAYLLHDGELVKVASSPTVYVVESGALRPIPSGEIFESVGWKWMNVVTVRDGVLGLHAMGASFEPQPLHAELAAETL
ncbi:hypothetical protein KJ781_04030 [Patescibacteria group bacterium]|nr:hypothetical protein [Patescibacteria group bacterium]MBU1448419.1 hypothetical protein [Patescibacteria group bacterium]MBU2613489.1 hypothetical protein [Patescibacteria group bacterium]